MSKRSRNIQGFTLIELLVVITIIAILAALAFPALSGAMNAAKKAQAKAMINNLKTSLTNYQTEYGRWPGLFGDNDPEVATADDADSETLYKILIGHADAIDNDENPRRIAFMEFNTKDLDDPASPKGIIDPWKQPYLIIVDSDYDNEIDGLPTKKSGDPTEITASIAVWSNGSDDDSPPSPNPNLLPSW